LLAAFIVAGCHSNNQTSGFGVSWVTLTDEPGDFSSYMVNVNSVTLTRNDGAVFGALGTVTNTSPQIVDFTKLSDISELWGTATIPVGTYTSATIVLDYTSAVIAVPVNGVPQKATVVGPTGAAVTTVTVNVIFDPANPLIILPTYASSSAVRLAIDFNLAASTTSVNLATNPVTVTVNPFMTAGISPPDNKLIRIRGPLINSSVGVDTYTVYVRPFHDVVDSLGLLTIFNDANTVYTINGKTYVGSPGLGVLSQTSAGTTITAAYTRYEPTPTPNATAGIFHGQYVIAGSTLEDGYTQGIEGDVTARNGNTLTLHGSTLALTNGAVTYNTADAFVLVGPGSIVTADNNTTLTGLNYNSIAVGQHIIARGIYTLPNNVVNIDASGSANSGGSVRLIPTSLFGSLVSVGTGSLVLNLQTINDWPAASTFTFAGNGTSAAADPSPLSYVVNTGALVIPDPAVGAPQWIDGLVAPFGSAPPDFNASTISAEATVPASLRVSWSGTGTTAPFSALSSTGMTIDLANAGITSAVMRFKAESINLSSLAASPQIVPQAATPPTAPGLPSTFTPLFAVGNPAAVAPAGINVYSVFATYVTQLTTVLAATPAVQFEARGLYDRTTNTFSASSINVVL
jgi:hypothetical protein